MTPFQSFELTQMGGNGDQGNLTAINYFTAPMSIQSYHGDTGGKLLQKTAFAKSAVDIGKEIVALTGSTSPSIVKDKDKDGDKIIRLIGPSSYGPTDDNPYPTFEAYLKAIAAANQATKIQNINAFKKPPTGGDEYDLYSFMLDLTATVDDKTAQLTGNITTTIAQIKDQKRESSKSGPTFDNATVTISASDQNAQNFVIYGQAINSKVVTFGPGWKSLGTYIQEVGLEESVLQTLQNLAIGEITSGLLMGFVNSSYVPSGSTPLKDMPSEKWWTLNPVVAFSDVQNNPNYYNQYANVIYKASNNGCYSIPYSDRLGRGPLVNSVQYNGETVDTWVVTLEAPVSASPAADII